MMFGAMSHRCLALMLVTCLNISVAMAAEFHAYAVLGQAFTDNVTLAPKGSEESEWITRIKPGIQLDHDGQGLDYNIDYSLEGLLYTNDSDRNGAYSNLASNALLNIAGEQLKLRAQGAITQVNVAPDRPVTDSNIFATENRTDANIWSVGPELKRPFIGQSEINAHYLYGEVIYDDPNVRDATRQTARAVLKQSDQSVSPLSYELVWDFDQIDYQNTRNDIEVQELYLQVGYRVLPALRLTATGGLDSNFEDPTNSSLSEPRWEAGFDSEFGDNLFSAGIGGRFFGTTYRVSWTRIFDNRQFKLAYNEQPATTDFIAFRQIPTGNPDDEPVPPPSGIERPGSVSRFIRRRGDATFDWTGFKSSLQIIAVWENREDVTPLPAGSGFTLNPDEKSWGASMEYRYLLGNKTTMSANAAWRKREYAVVDPGSGSFIRLENDTIVRVLGRIDYVVGQRTNIGFQLRLDRRDGTTDGLQDYSQFLALVDLSRTF